MQRRTYLALTGASLTTAIAGCGTDEADDNGRDGDGEGDGGGGGGGGDTTDDEDAGDGGDDENGTPADNQPSIQASDADAQGVDGELDIAFDARTYTRLEDGDQFWEPERGEVFFLGQYLVANVGDQAVDLAGGQLAITADGEEAGWTVVKDGSRFRVTLEPGDELNEWLVHTIPEGASDVDVSYEATGDVAATVTHDESIEFTFPET